MKLTDDDRLKIETFAKEAARRKYRRCHPRATDAQAFAFAVRNWRSLEFFQIGCDCLALAIAIDEAKAAPFN